VDTIGAARAAFDDALVTPSWADRAAIMQAADAYALAVLEECWHAAHNEYGYLSEVEFAVALGPLRARIGSQEHAEPPQEEGTHEV
jgi:hypothetical protein